MALSPMMRHYLDTKDEYPDCILFYRLGDFYEMFFDDAKLASRELELTLTGKDCGLDERAPMCGVPFHAADTYINKLVEKGYKVAVAEQMEDPKKAKGLVKREVIRVVTPGTVTSESVLDGGKNLYTACAAFLKQCFGLAFCDVSTGEFFVTSLQEASDVTDEILKYEPAEILVPESALSEEGGYINDLKAAAGACITTVPDSSYSRACAEDIIQRHFHAGSVSGLGLADRPGLTEASGALLYYLHETQKNALPHITNIRVYESSGCMLLDNTARRNLELTETLRDKKKRGSLLWVLDHTKTAMGARMLRGWIERPLIERGQIEARQDAVEELFDDPAGRAELSEYLGPVYDLERLAGRISTRNANPRDLTAFRTSLEMLPAVRQCLLGRRSPLLQKICEDLDVLDDMCGLIASAIEDDPPFAMTGGGIIRAGYSEDCDTLRSARTEGKQWLADLEASERERSGIKNLRVRFNKVFGYYIEVTNSFLDLVPEDYIRKQTLTGGERFTTVRLKELESMILGADEKLSSLEYELFCGIRETLAAGILRIQKTAKAIACLDALISLAAAAEEYGYVRPRFNDDGRIDITDGRHPVVERMLPPGEFIPNDTHLDDDAEHISIITGPNMAGKSTYMRQTALIVIMAQAGSFVPARSADLCICDRVFTRVGASDDLGSGQSTFMVEMSEVANILRNAGPQSLIILDEIGRGTSTFDGMSIAWAVVEYIADRKLIGAKTLFATHYHELTQLEGRLEGVKNHSVAVRESGDGIIFLRKIVDGGADQSYGIQVSKLAGVPKAVTDRAAEILAELDKADITRRAKMLAAGQTEGQLTFDFTDPAPAAVKIEDSGDLQTGSGLLKALKAADPDDMTPREALELLFEWKREYT